MYYAPSRPNVQQTRHACRSGVRGRGPFHSPTIKYQQGHGSVPCHSDPARGAEAPPPSALPAGAAAAPVLSPPFEPGAGSGRPPVKGEDWKSAVHPRRPT